MKLKQYDIKNKVYIKYDLKQYIILKIKLIFKSIITYLA
jgi:hypothetical protein